MATTLFVWVRENDEYVLAPSFLSKLLTELRPAAGLRVYVLLKSTSNYLLVLNEKVTDLHATKINTLSDFLQLGQPDQASDKYSLFVCGASNGSIKKIADVVTSLDMKLVMLGVESDEKAVTLAESLFIVPSQFFQIKDLIRYYKDPEGLASSLRRRGLTVKG